MASLIYYSVGEITQYFHKQNLAIKSIQLLLIRANIEVSSDEDDDYSDEVICE